MIRRFRSAAAAASLMLAGAAGWAQAPVGSRLSGIVIDGSSGRPLSGAVVTVSGRGLAAKRAVVDRDGRFSFASIPPGAFGVQAIKPGYIGGAAGQARPTSLPRPVEVSTTAPAVDLTLRLWKLGVIAGRVLGDSDEPLTGVEMHALRRALIGGRWSLVDTANAATDDRGRYRISTLPPGDYAVVARPPRTRDVALLLATLSANPAYAADIMTAATMSGHGDPALDPGVRDYGMLAYPSAPSPSRQGFLTIDAAAERLAIDFRLRSSRVVHVSGIASGPGVAAAGLVVRLVPADIDTEASPLDAGVATCDDEGRFSFAGVTPGRYIAVAQTNPGPTPAPPAGPAPGPGSQGILPAPALPAEPTLWARLPITVGALDINALSLAVKSGFRLSGALAFDGGPAPSAAEVAALTLRLDSIDQPPPGNAPVWRGRVDRDGRFTTMGVPPGEYLLRAANAPRGWTVQSAMIAGHDALDEPVTIAEHDVTGAVIALRLGPLASLSGVVRDASGLGAGDSTVLVFPADRSAWRDTSALSRRIRATRPLLSGAYAVQGLPAGEYCVVALAGDAPVAWQDPPRLQAWLPRAARVQIAIGAASMLNLQVQR